MRIARLAFVLVCSSLLGAGACSENNDPVAGFDLLPGILDSTAIRTLTIPTSDLDTFFQTTRSTGQDIWAGITPEVGSSTEAKAFLRFPALAIPAAAVITGATLVLNADAGGDYGNPVGQDLAIEQVIAANWYTNTSQGWPFDSHIPTTPPAVFEVAVCDTPDVRITAAVPPDLVSFWVARPDSNYGLALVPRGGGGWKRFRAQRRVISTGSGTLTLAPPVLDVRYTVAGQADTIRLDMREYTTLYSTSPDVAGGTGAEPYALIGGPYDFRAVVGFNLDAIATDASVNRLRLTLHIDPSQVFIGQSDPNVTIGAYEVAELPGEMLDPLPTVGFAVNPVARVTVNAAADTSFVLDVTALGQRITRGVLLKVDQSYPSLVRLGVVTREGNAAARPQLGVTYGLPPRVRL